LWSYHLSDSGIGAASPHQVFQLGPLAREQELRGRAVEAGLIELADSRAQLDELPAQGLDPPLQGIIAHGGRARLSGVFG
jgi:hypothetical protein